MVAGVRTAGDDDWDILDIRIVWLKNLKSY